SRSVRPSFELREPLLQPGDSVEQLVNSSRLLGKNLAQPVELILQGLEIASRGQDPADIGQLHSFAVGQLPNGGQARDAFRTVSAVPAPAAAYRQPSRELSFVD